MRGLGAPLVSRLRARLPARPPEVLVLAAFLLSAAACLTLAVLAPMSARAPLRLGAVLIAVALVLTVATFAVGHRVPRWALLAEAVVGVVLNTVLVAESTTGRGAMVDALAYSWLTVYVAFFFPRAAGAFSGLVVVLFGAGLLIAGLPAMLTGWAVFGVTTVMASIVVARLSRVMRRNAVTDALTSALNRTGLAAAAERVAPRRRRGDQDVIVAVLDLDDFKRVNDRDGHAAGDRLLVDLVAAWRAALRHDDVLARTGGDEFVAILPRTSLAEAEAILDRLQRAHPAGWSAGAARWSPGEPLDAALEEADRRLYATKGARTAAGSPARRMAA